MYSSWKVLEERFMKKLLIGDVTLEDLLDRLSFSEENVQSAVLEQAKLFFSAADYRIKKMRKYQEAKARLEQIRIHESLKLREKNSNPEKGKKALTEKYLSDLVEQKQIIKEARAQLDQSERLEEWAKLLLEAYRQRRDSLRVYAQFAYVEDNFRVGENQIESMKEKRERLKRSIKDREEEDQ